MYQGSLELLLAGVSLSGRSGLGLEFAPGS